MTADGDETSKITSLSPESKAILHQSILNYFHRSGFTRTFKRFQSEAQIQNDSGKASSVELEDLYRKYIDARSQTEDQVVVEPETKAKKKKKNKQDLASSDEIKETKSDEVKKPVDDTMNGSEVNESKKKTKDKKEKKQDLVPIDEIKETKSDEVKKTVDDTMNGLEVNESEKKTKDKKKKNKQQEECPEENGDVDSKKSSKKRKRLLSDENGDWSEEPAKQDNADEIKAHGNEKPEMNGVEKSGSQKSGKKQRTGSAEPKTVNAFQRVKIDQVEFAHEKLQDNSYWAKDGAEVGYGAKAQEVLGQVRGRDFRHEKTKKKRGSYRGGQIDLQSHSIKFDYSDEE